MVTMSPCVDPAVSAGVQFSQIMPAACCHNARGWTHCWDGGRQEACGCHSGTCDGSLNSWTCPSRAIMYCPIRFVGGLGSLYGVSLSALHMVSCYAGRSPCCCQSRKNVADEGGVQYQKLLLCIREFLTRHSCRPSTLRCRRLVERSRGRILQQDFHSLP